jgi:hypothetical protein
MQPTTDAAPNADLPTGPRTAITGLCISSCALLGLLAAPFAVGPRGAVAPALLDASNPILASMAVLSILAAAAGISLAIARPVNAAVALFCVGCGIAAYAMRSGTVADAVFQGAAFRWFGLETLGWGVCLAIVSLATFRVGGPLPDVPPIDADASLVSGVLRRRALLGLLAALVSVPVLLFTLVGSSKGQAIGTCALAGVATAFVARLYAAHEQPVLLFAAPCLVLGAAQLALAGGAMAGIDARFASGALSPILCAMPADIAAGSLCGVAVGLGWSRGLVKRSTDD